MGRSTAGGSQVARCGAACCRARGQCAATPPCARLAGSAGAARVSLQGAPAGRMATVVFAPWASRGPLAAPPPPSLRDARGWRLRATARVAAARSRACESRAVARAARCGRGDGSYEAGERGRGWDGLGASSATLRAVSPETFVCEWVRQGGERRAGSWSDGKLEKNEGWCWEGQSFGIGLWSVSGFESLALRIGGVRVPGAHTNRAERVRWWRRRCARGPYTC